MEYTDKYSYTRGQSIDYSFTLHVLLLPGKYLIPRNIYETVRERLVNSPVQLNMPSILLQCKVSKQHPWLHNVANLGQILRHAMRNFISDSLFSDQANMQPCAR